MKKKDKSKREHGVPAEKVAAIAAIAESILNEVPPALPGPGEFKTVPHAKVRPDPNQPRKTFDQAKLEELAESIRLNGILSPLVVQLMPAKLKIEEPNMFHEDWQVIDQAGAVVFAGNEGPVKMLYQKEAEEFYQIVFGERRWRASELAGLKEVPVIVRELTEREVFVHQFVENQARENLTALEEAKSFAAQIAKRKETNPEFTADKLAEELSISRSTVYNRLTLTRLTEPVLAALTAGTIQPTQAGEIAMIPSRADQEEMLEVIRENLQAGQAFSFREVRDYIQNNYAKQLSEAKFDPKEADYFPGGVPAEVNGNSELFPGPCTKCPMRSGNMKEMFPDIKNPNVCTSPKCFAEKHKAHGDKMAREFRDEGCEIITREEYFKKQDQFVRPDGGMQVGTRWMSVSQVLGKKKVTPVKIQAGAVFEDLYRKEDLQAAGEANGLDFTVPKPKPQPKAPAPSKPKPAPEMSAAEKEKFLEQQRKQEEKERKRLEAEAAAHKLAADVAAAGLAQLQSVIEKLPVNAKSETEFWGFLCSKPEFLQTMIFYNSHNTLFERRKLSGDLKKVVAKMTYQEFRSVIVEQLIVGEGSLVYGPKICDDLGDMCKHFGVDLKKIERELESKNGELAGMPEPEAKSKPKAKKK